jgi:hypothetical protein
VTIHDDCIRNYEFAAGSNSIRHSVALKMGVLKKGSVIYIVGTEQEFLIVHFPSIPGTSMHGITAYNS